jgi:hypothetical protein
MNRRGFTIFFKNMMSGMAGMALGPIILFRPKAVPVFLVMAVQTLNRPGALGALMGRIRHTAMAISAIQLFPTVDG